MRTPKALSIIETEGQISAAFVRKEVEAFVKSEDAPRYFRVEGTPLIDVQLIRKMLSDTYPN
jgi:hypothetical protein